MKYWKAPKDNHIVYEAFTAVADGRIEKCGADVYKCFSSSGNKFYTITFSGNGFASNDNMAFYRKEFSYPMLAVLLYENIILVDKKILNYFKKVFWKEINTKNKNNYLKSVDEVLDSLRKQNVDIETIKKVVDEIYKQVCKSRYKMLDSPLESDNGY